jgi:uncharacterized membrane protein YphA (DoxX/SURF4 family)
MTFRQRLGLGLPPYLLRLALAATFIWSGAAKFQYQIQLSPQDEATYFSIRDGSAAPAAPKTPAKDAPAPDASDSTDGDQPAEGASGSTASLTDGVFLLVQDGAADKSADSKKDAKGKAPTQPGMHPFIAQLTLMIHSAATPDDQGRSLLPAFMGSGKSPLWLAYAASLTELIGGVAILLGLFTRLWALGVMGVMVMALWMTAVGPVVIMGAPGWPSFMPVLPALNGYAFSAWQTWLWQFILAASAGSLACLGAGAISLDRLFFRKKNRTTEADEDSDD